MKGELVSLHHGQGLDILWRDTVSCPTEEQYIAMVTQSRCSLERASLYLCVLETGGLLRIAVRLMIACKTTESLENDGYRTCPVLMRSKLISSTEIW